MVRCFACRCAAICICLLCIRLVRIGFLRILPLGIRPKASRLRGPASNAAHMFPPTDIHYRPPVVDNGKMRAGGLANCNYNFEQHNRSSAKSARLASQISPKSGLKLIPRWPRGKTNLKTRQPQRIASRFGIRGFEERAVSRHLLRMEAEAGGKAEAESALSAKRQMRRDVCIAGCFRGGVAAGTL